LPGNCVLQFFLDALKVGLRTSSFSHDLVKLEVFVFELGSKIIELLLELHDFLELLGRDKQTRWLVSRIVVVGLAIVLAGTQKS